MNLWKRYIILLVILIAVPLSEERPLSMKAFDAESFSHSYNRGAYMIIIPSDLSSSGLK